MVTASTLKAKLPNYDLPLPEDVLAILDKNRYFVREPCKNPPIFKDTVVSPIASPTAANKSTSIKLPDDGKNLTNNKLSTIRRTRSFHRVRNASALHEKLILRLSGSSIDSSFYRNKL